MRNVPAIRPQIAWPETLDVEAIAEAVRAALLRLDLHEGNQAVALCYQWLGSATYSRLDAFCRGVVAGLRSVLAKRHPVIMVGEGDVGGLVGIHAHQMDGNAAIISVDGIVLAEFDFIDIGSLMSASGAVPVVIKSLVFPTSGHARPVSDDANIPVHGAV